ncbi:MAG: LamG domain-containing protein [Candidatus Micrarchaeota archaeon]|nr:LamG domain-containing protein [Candidatus Micrarchaeota archaeon]
MKKIWLLILLFAFLVQFQYTFNITFVHPTPSNLSSITNNSIIINTSIANGSANSTAFIDFDNSLVAWYRFNNEQGENNSLYRDWSIYQHNLTCSGSQCPTSTTAGRLGSARTFDGTNDVLTSRYSDALDFSNANFTYDFWVFSTITDNNYRGIVGFQNMSVETRSPSVWIHQRNRLHFGFGNGSHWLSYTTPANVIPNNVWTHVAITFDGTYVCIYINGTLMYNLSSFSGQRPYPNKGLTIGGIDNYFRGRIDEVRIFRRALSPEEIRASYNASANRLFTALDNLSYGTHNFIAYAQNPSGTVVSTERRYFEIIYNNCSMNQTNNLSSCGIPLNTTNVSSNESIIIANNSNVTIQNLTSFFIETNQSFVIGHNSSLLLDLGKCSSCQNQTLTIRASEIVLNGNIISYYSYPITNPRNGPNITMIAEKIYVLGNISSNGEFVSNNSIGNSGDITLIANEIVVNSTLSATGNRSGKIEFISNKTLNISKAVLNVSGRMNNGTINITWGEILDESNATFIGRLPSHTKLYNNGSITFEGETDFRNFSTDLNTSLIVYNNFAFANSTKYPYLNRSAIITFYDLPWKGHEMVILKNGRPCNDCQLLYTNGSVSSFRVTSFSNYTTYSNITQCGSLSTPDTYYSLNTSITFNGTTCLTVNANNIMIDGRGFSLIGLNQSNTRAIFANGRSDLKIYNLTILNVSTGIHLTGEAGDRVEIVNVSINISFSSGCSLGSAICMPIILFDVDDVIIRNVTTDSFYYGIVSYNGNNNVTIRETITYARAYPNIYVRTTQTNITIFNNSIFRGPSGNTAIELVTNTNSSNINISNNYIQSNDYAITISNDPTNISIINNRINFGTSRGILISGLNSTNRARNILIKDNLINGSYFNFRIDNHVINVTFENNTVLSTSLSNQIINLNGNAQTNANITIKDNYIEGQQTLLRINSFFTNNTGTNEFVYVNNNVFNNTYGSDSTTYSNCVEILNNNSNIYFWNNTFRCYRFFIGAPTNPPNELHNLTNVWANFSNIGNRYIFRNGTEVWPLENITDTDGNFYADIGSDRPFNHTSLTTTHWLAFINDFHPFTLRRYTLCNEQINQSLTLNNSLNCSGTALNIVANNVILDCANFTINHSWTSPGNGISIINRTNVTIRNCIINKFSNIVNQSIGIFITNSSNIIIENTRINITGNFSSGLLLNSTNLSALNNINISSNGSQTDGLTLIRSFSNNITNAVFDTTNTFRCHAYISQSQRNILRTISFLNKGLTTKGIFCINSSGNLNLGNVSNFSFSDIYFDTEFSLPDHTWNVTVEWPIVINVTDHIGKPITGALVNFSSLNYSNILGNYSTISVNGFTIDYLNDTLLLGNGTNITYRHYNLTAYVLANGNTLRQNSSLVIADSQKTINLQLYNMPDPSIIFLPPTPENNQIIYNTSVILNTTVYSLSNAYGFYDFGDLIAYWPFDSYNSTHVRDISRYNNHGTFAGNNNQSNVSGRFGIGWFFDGNDDRIVVPNSNSLNPTQQISIVAWFNATQWGTNRRILQKGYSDNQYRLTAETGNFKWHITGITEIAVSLPTTNQWHHVVGTYNGSEQRLYINGILNFTRSATIQLPVTTDHLEIGSKPNTLVSGDRFNGTLDEIMIFARALSPSEITAMYNNNQSTLITTLNHTLNYSMNYTFRVYARNAQGALTFVDRNYSVYVRPYVSQVLPFNGSYGNPGITNFTCYANESIFGLKNGTLFIYYSNGSLLYQNTTNFSSIAQNFSFSVNIPTNDTYYWSCQAYDNLNNFSITQNYTYYIASDNTIFSCGTLDTPNKEYVLGANLSTPGSCFSVIANNITLNCNGNNITFAQTQPGNGILANSVTNLTITNCIIQQLNATLNQVGWINGTFFNNTNNSRIINTTIITRAWNATGSSFVNSIRNSMNNITISTTGINSYGVLFTFSSNNNSVNSLTFNSTNNSAHGIFANQTSFINLTNSTLVLTGNNSYGFYAFLGGNHIINNITTTSSGRNTRPIMFDGTMFNTVANSNINANNTNAFLIIGISSANYFVHNISNVTIRNLPVFYYTGTTGYSLPCNSTSSISNLNASMIGFGNCNNINVSNISSIDGIILGFVTNSRFENVTSNSIGIGMIIYQSNRINITNLNISTNSTLSASSALQFEYQTSNITIRNANVEVRNNNGYGISGYAMTENYFYNMSIQTSNNTDSYAIYISSANSNLFENISIITNGTNNHAIFFTSGTNRFNNFRNFNVTTYGSNSDGAYLYYSSSNSYNTFTNFNITTQGSSSQGLELFNSENNTIDNTNITTYGSSASGIYMNAGKFNIIRNITINTYNSSSSGIAFNTNGNSNNFSNITILTNGSTSYGIYLFGSNNNVFSNMNITSNNVTSSHIFFYTANNNSLFNLSFSGQAINQTYIRDVGANFLINSTNINRSAIGFFPGAASTWNVTLQWYVRLNITDNNLNPLENVSSNFTNALGFNGLFNLTASNGLTNWLILNETVYRGAEGNISYNDYNFTANKTNYFTNSTNSTINESKTIHIILTPFGIYCGIVISSSSNLTTNLTCNGNAITINGSNISLDCQNYIINYSMLTQGFGISVNGNNVTIKNCIIYQGNTSIASSHGIIFNTSNFSNIELSNISVSNNSVGLLLINSHGGIFNNNNFTTDNGNGIRFINSGNNTFTFTSINSINGYHLLFEDNSSNNLVANSSLRPNNLYSVYTSSISGYSGNNSLLNVSNINTTNTTGIVFEGLNDNRNNLSVQWYVRVNVTNVNGNPVSGANVNAKSSLNENFALGNTDINGLTNWYALNRFTYFPSSVVNHNLYNITATHGSKINSTLANITDNLLVLIIIPANLPPIFVANSHYWNSTLGGKPTEFKINITDDFGISGYIFAFDNCTGTFTNSTWISANNQTVYVVTQIRILNNTINDLTNLSLSEVLGLTKNTSEVNINSPVTIKIK